LKGFVSFKGTKNVKYNSDAPGPGAYKPADVFSTTKYSFTRSKEKNKI
jgi:hypothetical protein